MAITNLKDTIGHQAPSQPARTKAKVEQLKQDSEIKKALEQTAGSREPARLSVDKKQKMFLGTYAVVLLSLGALYYLLRLHVFNIGEALIAFLQRADLGALAIATVVAIGKSVDVYLIDRVDDAVAEYNIRRILKLVLRACDRADCHIGALR
jgi:hypothetical protein